MKTDHIGAAAAVRSIAVYQGSVMERTKSCAETAALGPLVKLCYEELLVNVERSDLFARGSVADVALGSGVGTDEVVGERVVLLRSACELRGRGQLLLGWRLVSGLNREEASELVTRSHLNQRRQLSAADFLRLPAPRVEHATGGWVGRAGQVALQQDALTVALDLGVRNRNCRQQRHRVRVSWALVQVTGVSRLDNVAEVHDGNTV